MDISNCPECGNGDFHIDSKEMSIGFDKEDHKLMAYTEESNFDNTKIECDSCKTQFKPTIEGLRKIS